MTHSVKIAVLPGDGIGPEVTAMAVEVLKSLEKISDLAFTFVYAPIGGAACDETGEPLPAETLALARCADAVLLGAVGGPKWDNLPRDRRPEQALLGLRSSLGVFANLRPVRVFNELAQASPLKEPVIAGVDILVVRELTGGIYFGEPRGISIENGKRTGRNTLMYADDEIARVAHVAFKAARSRRRELVSIDKSNVLECTRLWRDVVIETARGYPDVKLSHMYVDNAAMQLVRNPRQFDVMLCDNMFGDILSDEAAMIAGSIGIMASASLSANAKGLFEPIHGSAPDIAGKNIANPLAAILSAALMLTHSCRRPDAAKLVESAVAKVLQQGLRTPDIFSPGTVRVGTMAMGEAVARALLPS